MRKNFRVFTICLLIACALLSVTAYAAYYNTYTKLATIPNGEGCNRAQGFAAGSSYIYSAKCNDNESKQVIYRTRISDGTTTLMTNGDTGGKYIASLGHANDMDTCTIDGKYHLFVATMKTGAESLVKLQYSRTTYAQLGGFELRCDGVPVSVCGVKKYAKDDNYIYFLFFASNGNQQNVTFYRGQIPMTADGGTINVTKAFDIDITNATVNGSKVTNLNSFLRQGIGYIASTDQLLVPLTNKNVSIILVYNNVSTATGTLSADPNLSFRITSSTFPTLFEIEGCDETNGKLYFNCNRKKDSKDIDNDAICSFNDFTIY